MGDINVLTRETVMLRSPSKKVPFKLLDITSVPTRLQS